VKNDVKNECGNINGNNIEKTKIEKTKVRTKARPGVQTREPKITKDQIRELQNYNTSG